MNTNEDASDIEKEQKQASRDFRSKTLSGLNWSVVTQVARQIFQFSIGVLLARLLTPEAYGLIGMILVFTGFANIFKDVGLGSALVQKQDTRPIHYTTVFWTNVGLGLLLTLVFIGVAPYVASFYDEPMLESLTMFMALNFFIDSFGIVQRMLLKKEMDFRRLAILRVTTMSIAGILAIALALNGFGVWSLAVQTVTASLIAVVVLWWMNDWRPSFAFSKDALGDLWAFSSNLFGFSAINYWVRNADNLLIGRFLGSGALGLYSKSYGLMLLPLRTISQTIGQVMFPAFSSIQHDRERIGRVYLKMTRVIALVTFPMMLGLIATAQAFVLGLFGPKWDAMIPILQILCVVGMIQSIGTLNGNLYQATGRTDLQLRVGGTIGVLGVGAILFGIWWGSVVSVAVCYAVFSFIAIYPSIRIAVSVVGLTFKDVFWNVSSVLACAITMAVMVYGLSLALPQQWPEWAQLIMQVLSGMGIYGGLVHSFRVTAYREARSLIIEQVRGGA